MWHRRVIVTLDEELRRTRGLSLEDYDVLHQLRVGPEGGRRMTELANALVMRPSSCTRLVDRLVERGLVERRADVVDRRAVRVSLTAAGRSAHRRAALTHVQGVEQVFARHLEAADLAVLDEVLDRLLGSA